jgi:hypothetical protein
MDSNFSRQYNLRRIVQLRRDKVTATVISAIIVENETKKPESEESRSRTMLTTASMRKATY